MKKITILLFVGAVAVSMATAGPAFGESAQSINLGIGTSNILPDCKATIYLVEYERMGGSKISILGRISQVDYKFDDGEHVEDGKPRGGDIGARHYSSGRMQGFFFGGSLGYWEADWTFTRNKGLPDQYQGEGRSNSLRANLEIGGRYPIGSSSVSIMPAFSFGRFFSSTSCEYTAPAARSGAPCNEESEVEDYAFLAVIAGIAF